MTSSKILETRDRLLEAAGEVFAAHGFRSTTVRRICERAGANVAAINYHFRDKEGLYAAVFKHAHLVSLEKYPPDLGLKPGARAEERLHAFVRSLLLRTLDQGRPAWHGQLMLREMVEPSTVLDSVVRSAIRPLFETLREIVRELLGPGATKRQVTLGAFSVVGQCLFYKHASAVIVRIVPEQRYAPKDIDELADHITRFSRIAIRAAAQTPKGART